ncbi:MAG: class I SAM-dependent methyltransferase [Gammaproteobacteria bacterium]|nr:class I SAM-dependent methyltransferase [Gammaproteobacteria bacterium]
MKPGDVASSYDQLAAFWASDRFPADNGISIHRRAVAFVKEKAAALDVGCGSSGRLIEFLRSEGFSPEGLDLSSGMLELARQHHPDVQFHQADICEWQPPQTYSFVSAWDSIWHVPLDVHEAVLSKIFDMLTPGGVAVFSMGGLDAPSETTNALMGPPVYHSTPGIPRMLSRVAASGCVIRHLEYDQYPELHVAVICQKAAS